MVAKCFRAARAGGGEGCGPVAGGKAGTQVGSTHELMQKACVKTIAGAYGIYEIHFLRGRLETLVASLRHCSFLTHFDHDGRHDLCQLGYSHFQIIRFYNRFGFACVG